MNQNKFIFKVLFISLTLSLLIRYGGPFLPISPTLTNVLGIVLLPSVVMAIALARRYTKTTNT